MIIQRLTIKDSTVNCCRFNKRDNNITLRKTYSSSTKHDFTTAKVSATDTCSITITDAVTATLDEQICLDLTTTDSSGLITRELKEYMVNSTPR